MKNWPRPTAVPIGHLATTFRRALAGVSVFVLSVVGWRWIGSAQLKPDFSDADVAAAFAFPQSLRLSGKELTSHGSPQSNEAWSSVELPEMSGELLSSLFVAYTNGTHGAVLVIHRTPNTITVTEGPPGLTINGTRVAVRQLDLTGDGVNEMFVTYSGASTSVDAWVFQVRSSGEISNIGPVNLVAGQASTRLSEATNFDLDGDGTQELISKTGTETTSGTPIYHLDDRGEYNLWKVVSFIRVFTRGVEESTHHQSTVGPLGFTTLQVVTGDSSLTDARIRSAEVKLNGLVVVPPGEFGEEIGNITVPVDLRSEVNSIEVVLSGSPGKRLALMVE